MTQLINNVDKSSPEMSLFQNEAARQRHLTVRRHESTKSIFTKYTSPSLENIVKDSIDRPVRATYSRGHEIHTPGNERPATPSGSSPIITRTSQLPGSSAMAIPSLHSPISDLSRSGRGLASAPASFFSNDITYTDMTTKEILPSPLPSPTNSPTISNKKKTKTHYSRLTHSPASLSGRIDKAKNVYPELSMIQFSYHEKAESKCVNEQNRQRSTSYNSYSFINTNKMSAFTAATATPTTSSAETFNVNDAVADAVERMGRSVSNLNHSYTNRPSTSATNTSHLSSSPSFASPYRRSDGKSLLVFSDQKSIDKFNETVLDRCGVTSLRGFYLDPMKVEEKKIKRKEPKKVIAAKALVEIDWGEGAMHAKKPVYRKIFYH